MKKAVMIATILAALCSCKKEASTVNYIVNGAASSIEWKGSATDHFHLGSFNVSGNLTTNGNRQVKSGDFVIPIASIQDHDLPEPVKQQLLKDLKENFFKIAMHPNATFHMVSTTQYEGNDTDVVEGWNCRVNGDFSMLGQTHRISFPAKISMNGDSLFAKAKFNIDRRKWGMLNYTDPNGNLYILPNVAITLDIHSSNTQIVRQ